MTVFNENRSKDSIFARKPLNRGRAALAVALAIGAHLLALLALGWPTPRFEPLATLDALPPIELSLVRIKPAAAPPAPAPVAGSAKPSRTAPPPQGAPAISLPAPPAPPAPSSALAAGPADCEPEDLPLLTEAERALCRNQMEVDKGRRMARESDSRTAREVARVNAAPRIESIPDEKRAAYDAVVQADAQPPPGPPVIKHGSGAGVSVTCSHMTFPLLSGVDVNPDLFAKKHKKERPSHGPVICGASF